MLKDCTILTCSYENINCLSNMLKSFIFYHGKGPHKIFISENSQNNICKTFLTKNNIAFFDNPGYSHTEGMNQLFNICKTKYALMVDTDIIFKKNLNLILQSFIENENNTLYGIFNNGEDRGNKKLHPRIAPWFCFINMDNIRKYKLKFNDPYVMGKKINDKYYDVGSLLYENIIKLNLKVKYFLNSYDYFYHYEGMSWRIQKFGNKETNIDLGGIHNNYNLFKIGQIIEEIYKKEVGDKFKNIIIKDKFI